MGLTFNGVDLGNDPAVSLLTPDLPNIDDTPRPRRDVQHLQGRRRVASYTLGDEERVVQVKGVFSCASHSAYLAARDRLAEVLDEAAGPCPLVFPDRPTQRLLATSLGFTLPRIGFPWTRKVAIDVLMEFALEHAYWEDLTPSYIGAPVNLLTDAESSFEDGNSNTWASVSGSILTNVTGTCWHGGKRLHIAVDAQWEGAVLTRYIPVQPGLPYTASAYVRWAGTPANPNLGISVLWYDVNQRSIQSFDTVLAGSTSWQRLVQATTAPANAAFARFLVRCTSTQSDARAIYLDGAQFEVGAAATDYLLPSSARNLLTAGEASSDGQSGSVDWQAESGGAVGTGAYVGGYYGSHSILVRTDAQYEGMGTKRLIPILSGHSYVLSAYVKAPYQTGATTGTVECYFHWFDASQAYISSTGTAATEVGKDWTRVQSLVTAAPPTAAYCVPVIRTTETAGWDWYVDAVQVEEAYTAASPFQMPVANAGIVINSSQVETPAVYTLTAKAAHNGGFSLTVGDYTAAYLGNLAAGDVLVLDPENLVFTKNGVSDCGNWTPMPWKQLWLPIGTTQVSLSTPNVGVVIAHRNRKR